MKKLIIILTAIVIFLGSFGLDFGSNAWAERFRREQTLREDVGGKVLSGATVTVYLAGTTTLANIYADKTTQTPLANSQTTTDSKGRYKYYVDNNDYSHTQFFKEVITKTGYSPITYDDIDILDIEEPWINSRNYASLEEANSVAYDTGKTLLIAKNHILTANTTLTTPVKVIKGGGFTKVSTYTLHFEKSFSVDGLFQVFFGFDEGGVTFGDGSVREIYAEWWDVDGTADDIQINAALASNAKIPIQLLAKTYNISALPSVIERPLRGAGWEKTILSVSGTSFGIKLGTYGLLENLKIQGSATAAGGIDLSNSSLSQFRNIKIVGFPNGIGIKAYMAYRQRGEHIYIQTCDTGILLEDNTTFHMVNGNISLCTNHAIDTAGSFADGYFEQTYFESNTGNITADLSGASNSEIVFKRCGFEDNGGSTANPRNIKHSGQATLTVEQTSFGHFSTEHTGTAVDLYLSGNQNNLIGNRFTQNTATSRNFIYAIGVGVQIFRAGNLYESASVSISDLMGGYFWEDYTYKPTVAIVQDRIRSGGSILLLNKAVPYALNVGDVSTSEIGEDDLRSSTIYKGQLAGKGGIRAIAAGTKTGGAGNKTIKLHFGATSWTIIGPSNTTTDWRIQAEIVNIEYNSQRISWMAWDGTTITQGYETASIDTLAADTVLKITGECADGGDVITQTMWVVECM